MNDIEIDNFIDHHEVIYIRHLMDSSKDAYKKLISEGFAAIHYQRDLKNNIDKAVLNNHLKKESYNEISRGRRALERFLNYARDGAIVVADYSEPNYTVPKTDIPKSIKIGLLPEKSSIEVQRYEPESSDQKEYPFGLFYKQVKLDNLVELGSFDLPLILAIHPRGNTVIHWQEGEEAIKFIYKRELGLACDLKSGYKVLFPAQQEVLCSEYLRLKAPRNIKIKQLLLPVGRGMKAIDIYGSNDTKTILAQVSFTTDKDSVKEKIISLDESLGSTRCTQSKEPVRVYFGPKVIENYVCKIGHDVVFISLEAVFNEMKETEILNDMLGIARAMLLKTYV